MKNRFIHLVILWAMSATGLLAQCPNVCQPLVYEGFSYPSATPLLGNVGGAGWAGDWTVQSNNNTVPGYSTLPGSLSYSTLRTFQNQLSGGSAFVRAGRAFNTNASGPLQAFIDANEFIGKPGTTLWVSLMLQKKQATNGSVYAALHSSNISWLDETQNNLSVGYFGTASNNGAVRNWSLRVNNTVTQTSVPISTSAPALLVLRLDFNTTGTGVAMWVNPATLGSSAPPTPALSLTTATPVRFQDLAMYLGEGAVTGGLDEVRVADSWRCVVPDAGVPENLMPVASLVASATTGMAPAALSFNGLGSSDSDGSLMNYGWTFADGGTATGPTPSYTFRYPGVQTAVLTVTDNCGQTASQAVTLTIRDANNRLSCYGSVRCERMASCGQANGRVIGSGGTSYTLTSSQGQTTSAPGDFQNLSARSYTLTVAGTGGCLDQYNLVVPTDSLTCPGWQPRRYAMQMGMGLEGVVDWDQARPFKDFMKTARRFQTSNVSGPGTWDSGLSAFMPQDPNGYPTQVPFTVTAPTSNPNAAFPQLIRMVLSTEGHMPLGQYLFLHDGQGTLVFSGDIRRVPNQPNTPGRIQVEVTGTGNCWMDIQASIQGNHLRNFRLIRPEDEDTYLINPFYDRFVERACYWSVLRFMDWQRTNNSPITNWSERARPDFYTQSTPAGVAYEHICQLANILQKDVWVNIPHQATDDYIQQMARLFRDQLSPNLNVYLEYSNEVWNWQFTQAGYTYNQPPAFLNYEQKYALRSVQCFRIWHEEWGARRTNVKRVLGTQSVNNYLGQNILGVANGEFDYFSPTWYFGYKDNSAAYAQLQSLGGSATPEQVVAATRQGFLSLWPNVRQNYRDTWLFGKEIAYYEGGQHMTSNPTIEPFQEANYQSQISPALGMLYREVLDSLVRWRTHTALAFVLTGKRRSQYGSWGHLETIDQDTLTQVAPKFSALMQYVSPARKTVCDPCRIISRQSGDWMQPQTWNWWRRPRPKDHVIIDTGHVVDVFDPAATGRKLNLSGTLRPNAGAKINLNRQSP